MTKIQILGRKNPLKGAYAHDLPEKLGEMLTGLYILLVSKVIKKGKNIHLQFQMKGVLLDNAAANLLCTMSLDFQQCISSEDSYINRIYGCSFNTTVVVLSHPSRSKIRRIVVADNIE